MSTIESKIAEIVKMRSEGKKNAQIAEELGLTYESVRGLYRRRNMARKCVMPLRGSTPVWSDDRVARLRELHALKWSDGQIAKEIGVSRAAVLGKRNRLGLEATHLPSDNGAKKKKVFVFNDGKKKERSGICDLRNLPGDPKPIGETGDLPSEGCLWLHGDTRTMDFQACGHERAQGARYCDTHLARTINHAATATSRKLAEAA